MTSEFEGTSYSTPYELAQKLIESNHAKELPSTDLAKNLSFRDELLPEHRKMALSEDGGECKLQIFDFSDMMGEMAIILYLDDPDEYPHAYLFDSERIYGLLFRLLDSDEFRPEETGYILERAIGRFDQKNMSES